MFQLKNEGQTGSIGRTIQLSLFLLLLGAGCTSVPPASKGPAVSQSAPPAKKIDFYNIMARMDTTSHSDSRPPHAASTNATARALQPANATPRLATTVESKPAVQAVPAPAQGSVATTAAPQPNPLISKAEPSLIVTNKASQAAGTKPPATETAAAVMTVKARSIDDTDDSRTYAGAGNGSAERPAVAVAQSNAWVQRGVLSLSVGCLGVGCFLLRVIRLGRLAGRLVSSGVRAAAPGSLKFP